MKVSRVLARKLLNFIQMAIGYLQTTPKKEDEAIEKLKEMARLIHNQTVETVNCEDCEHKPSDGKP